MIAAAWAANATRVGVLLRALGHPLPWGKLFGVCLAAELGVAATPAGVGGPALYVGLLGRRGVPAGTVASLLAVEWLIDLACFLPLAILALLGEVPASVTLPRGAALGAALGAAGLGVAAAAVWVMARRSAATGWDATGRAWWRVRAARRRATGAVRTLYRLGATNRKALWCGLVLAAVQWSCRFSVLPLLVLVMGGGPGLLALWPLQAVLLLVGFAVVIPGGGGSAEVLGAAVLPLFLPLPAVSVVVLTWRFFTYYLYLAAGGAALAWNSRRHGGDRRCSRIRHLACGGGAGRGAEGCLEFMER